MDYLLLTLIRILIGVFPVLVIRFLIWRKRLSIWASLGWCVATYFYSAVLNGKTDYVLGLQYAAFFIETGAFCVLRFEHTPWDRRPRAAATEEVSRLATSGGK